MAENIAAFFIEILFHLKLTPNDRSHVSGLLASSKWWEVRLEISIGRAIFDERMVTRIVEQFYGSGSPSKNLIRRVEREHKELYYINRLLTIYPHLS